MRTEAHTGNSPHSLGIGPNRSSRAFVRVPLFPCHRSSVMCSALRLPSAIRHGSLSAVHASSLPRNPAITTINDKETVYLIAPEGKIGIPSIDVFTSWGYSFGKAVLANVFDHPILQVGVMSPRAAGELSPY